MRIAIVEDERIVARRLVRILHETGGDRIDRIVALESLDEALEHVATHSIDVLFLDLNLHGEDGYALLEHASAGAFETIVVSAHADRAARAFEYGVLDFIVKPYTAERVARALQRLDQPSRETVATLSVRKGDRIQLVPLEEVVRIEGAGDYSELHCRDGGVHLHARTLKSLEHLLPGAFLRIHRSHIVRLDQVREIRVEAGRMHVLVADVAIPVSRSRRREVRDRLAL